MTLPTYEIAVPDSFRPALIHFLQEIALDVRHSARRGTDPRLRERLPEYLAWTDKCIERVERATDGYAALDEKDMTILAKDVLLSMVSSCNERLSALVSSGSDRQAMRAVVKEMREANSLCGRLRQIVNIEIFDASYRGERGSAEAASGIASGG